MYSWGAAVKGEGSPDTIDIRIQGVCPDGWHLPGKNEWQKLIDNVQKDIGSSIKDGAALKSKSGWDGRNGNDKYGFAALPAGYRSYTETFFDLKTYTYYWAATEFPPIYSYDPVTKAYAVDLYGPQDDLHFGNEIKRNGYSVRCIKD